MPFLTPLLAISVDYRFNIMTGVFVALLTTLSSLVAYNFYKERKHLSPSDKSFSVRLPNRFNTIILICYWIAAPDFQGVRGIYHAFGPVLNVTFGLGACFNLANATVYLYAIVHALETSGQRITNSTHAPVMARFYAFASICSMVLTIVLCGVRSVDNRPGYYAAWNIYLGIVCFLSIALFSYASFTLLHVLGKLRGLDVDHLRTKIRKVQMVGIPLVTLIGVLLVYNGVGYITQGYSAIDDRTGNSFNIGYGQFAWASLAICAVFIYISWVPVAKKRINRRDSAAISRRSSLPTTTADPKVLAVVAQGRRMSNSNLHSISPGPSSPGGAREGGGSTSANGVGSTMVVLNVAPPTRTPSASNMHAMTLLAPLAHEDESSEDFDSSGGGAIRSGSPTPFSRESV